MLKLVPKKGSSAPFTRATVWVDDEDAIVRQFEIAESNGVVRRIRLVTIALNAPVDRATFSFTPPKGVKIVDQSR
jgi:outer membrane lipoprotein-sorting protein